MSAPLGNKNALNNKGGGRTSALAAALKDKMLKRLNEKWDKMPELE